MLTRWLGRQSAGGDLVLRVSGGRWIRTSRRDQKRTRPPQASRCKATWKREFKLPRREAGPPYHHDDKVV